MATARTTVNQVKRQVGQVDENPWVEGLARFGYIARGILYITIGALASGVVLGARSAPKDPAGAIGELGKQPYGQALLLIMAVGLAGYSMWGIVRAIWDPLNRGTDLRGLVERAGFIMSAFSYAVLIIPTVQFLSGRPAKGQTQATQDLTARLLALPNGTTLVALVGAFFLIVAAAQFYTAWKKDFKKDLRPKGLTSQQISLAVRIGQFGHAARGVVFALIGIFIIQAARTFDPSKAQGLDGALMKLAQQPYGPLLLVVVSLGLIAFGVYSLISARWNRVG